MPMVDDGGWHIPGGPSQKARAQAEVRIIAERKKRLVKAAGLLEKFAMVKSGAGIRPEDFFRFVILADVGLHRSPAAILPIPINQMAGFVDDALRVLKQDFAGEHADAMGEIAIANQFLEPIRFRDGIGIEQRDPLASRLCKGQVVRLAEAAVI